MDNRKKRFDRPDYYRGAMRWMGIGIEFCIVVGLFAFIGNFLDIKEKTSPGWMIMFFLFGFALMVRRLR